MRHYRSEDVTPDFLANLKYSDITPEELEEVIGLARGLYNPEDLQRHLDRDDGIPLEDVIRKLLKSREKLDTGSLA